MANHTISQIKLGTTIYDICDYAARNNFLDPQTVNCTLSADQSISATSNKSITWSSKNKTVTDWIYFGYLYYNTASQNVYVVTLTENGIKEPQLLLSGQQLLNYIWIQHFKEGR